MSKRECESEIISLILRQLDLNSKSGWPHSSQDKIPCVFPVLDNARVFYPYFQGFMEGRSLLVVYVFTSPDSPRGPPWNEGHRPKVRHETDVLEVPASGTTRTQFLF